MWVAEVFDYYDVLVGINACSWAKDTVQLATTHLFILQIKWKQRKSEEKEWQLEMPFSVRLWKREMAVSRRYNNVTLCGNAFVYFSFSWAFSPFSLPIFSMLGACCLYIFTAGFVCVSVYVYECKCAHVFALWNIIQLKRIKKSFARRLFSLFFFLDFCFRVFFFTRIHIKYDCSRFNWCWCC